MSSEPFAVCSERRGAVAMVCAAAVIAVLAGGCATRQQQSGLGARVGGEGMIATLDRTTSNAVPTIAASAESPDKGSAHRAQKKGTKWFEKFALIDVRINSNDINEYGTEVGDGYDKTEAQKAERGAGGGLAGSGVGKQSPGSSSDGGLNLGLSGTGSVAGMQGKQSDSPQDVKTDNSVTRQEIQAMQAQLDALAKTAAGQSIPTNPTVPAGANGATPLASYLWVYGGVDHSAAVLDTRVVISNLAVSGNGITYSVTGLSNWAPNSQGMYAIACAFYERAMSEYVGGKFEWSRVDTTSRDFGNVDSGYPNDGVHDWVKPASGTPFAYALVSPDGKHCSNVLMDVWP